MTCATDTAVSITNAEIREHELLDDEQRKIIRALRGAASRRGESFTMLGFAEVALRATAVDYGAVTDGGDEAIPERVIADARLRDAAVLYVYEALRATDNAIIREWPEFDEMLRMLVSLAGDLPSPAWQDR